MDRRIVMCGEDGLVECEMEREETKERCCVCCCCLTVVMVDVVDEQRKMNKTGVALVAGSTYLDSLAN